MLTGPNTKTLPVAIAEYGAEDLNYWSLSAAAATVTIRHSVRAQTEVVREAFGFGQETAELRRVR